MITPDRLQAFLSHLRGLGFRIGLEHFRKSLDVLLVLAAHGRSGEADQDKVARWLGPIVCSTPAEQAAFRQAFASFFPRTAPLAAPAPTRLREPPPDAFGGRRLAPLVGLLVLVVATAILWQRGLLPSIGPKREPVAPAATADSSLASSSATPEAGLAPTAEPAAIAPSEVATAAPVATTAPTPEPTPEPTAAPTPTPTAEELTARRLDWWRRVLTALPLAVVAAWLAFRRFTAILVRRTVAGNPPVTRLVVHDDPPPLFAGPEFSQLSQELRRPLESEAAELDVAETVRLTSAAGGMFSPAYRARTQTPEYLILIDRAGGRDHQARLLDGFAARLRDEGVHVDRFFFDGDPRLCEAEGGGRPVLLEELASRHPGHCLVLITDAAALLDTLTFAPKDWASALTRWARRALVTTVPIADWGRREATIGAALGFYVLPATTDALLLLPTALADPNHSSATSSSLADASAHYPNALRARPRRWLEPVEPDAAEIDDALASVKSYLGGDAFTWLEACAVYPGVHWEISLTLAHALASPAGGGRFEDRLLRITGLPWFRSGSMPDWLRLRLLREMPQAALEATRTTLRTLLMNALRTARHAFALEITAAERSGAWRKIRRLLLADARSGPMRDAIFLDFVGGRARSRLAFALPRAVAELLPGGLPPGAGPAATLLLASLVSLSIWSAFPRLVPGARGIALPRATEVASLGPTALPEPEATIAPAAVEPAATAGPTAVATEVASLPPEVAQPIKPSAPTIRSSSPTADRVALRRGGKQLFTASLDLGSEKAPPGTRWLVDGKVVKQNANDYLYEVPADASAAKTASVRFEIGDGTGVKQTRDWTIDVAPPQALVLASSTPSQNDVDATAGDALAFRVQVSADGGVPLTYAWTVNGKAAASKTADLKLTVPKDPPVSTVAVKVSDGLSSVDRTWQVTSLGAIAFQPDKLATVRYDAPQDFRVELPADLAQTANDATWTVDGTAAAQKGTSFTLKAFDPAMVRQKPVVVAVAGSDAKGRKFNHQWSFSVVPPAPEVTGSQPPSGNPIAATAGQVETFQLSANAPLGGQVMSYVFEVNGTRQTPSSSPSFAYTATDAEATIVGYVQDNYQQVSAQKVRWVVRGSGGGTGEVGDVETRVRQWLGSYQAAWNSRDAAELGKLRGLDATQISRLETSLAEKQDLKVTFSDLQIQPNGATGAVATYQRTDSWTEQRDGRPVSRSASVRQTFAIEGGRVKEVGVTQKDQ